MMMSKNRPPISVCMASFNGEKYIEEQIVSILKQLNEQDELIISDDNSTDSTIEIIYGLNDNRIKCYTNSAKSPSIIANFENSISRASGEYIFLADQDDIWLDKKVETMAYYLTNYDLVVSDCSFIDSNGKVQAESYQKLYRSGKGFVKNLAKNSFLGNCIAFKSNIKSVALPFPKELYMASQYHIYHDVWIGLISSLTRGRIVFIPFKLSMYRRHESNASPTSTQIDRSPNTTNQKIIGRYWIVLALLKRLLLISLRYFS